MDIKTFQHSGLPYNMLHKFVVNSIIKILLMFMIDS